MKQDLISTARIQLLSKRMVVPLFMFGGFAGGLSLVFASVFIPGLFGGGSWFYLFVFGILGIALIALGLRFRVAKLNVDTKEIQIGWGTRWTWVFKTIRPDDWTKLDVSKVQPVGVMPRGSTMGVYQLTPYWKLVGEQKNGRRVFLAQYPTEQEAIRAKEYFVQQFNLGR